MEQVPSFLAAFIAGIVSFLSPCVLPLVPGYVAMLSGTTTDEILKDKESVRSTLLMNSLLFILGFSMVFIALGAAASAVGAVLLEHKVLMMKVAGVAIVLFGIFLLGLIKIPTLYSDKRFQGKIKSGPVGSLLLGLAFAFGWSPCIGPILTGILFVAGTRETLLHGVFLLAIYSAGLGIPFLLTALALEQFMGFYQRFRRYMAWVERFAGAFLIVIGVMIYTNRFTWFSSRLGFLNELIYWIDKQIS